MKDKETILELQKLDCNCNDCVFMKRDIEKRKSFDYLHTESPNAAWRLNYGDCEKFNKPVTFIPNILQVETQNCFMHRKDSL